MSARPQRRAVAHATPSLRAVEHVAVRDEIEDSWRRSRLCGLTPEDPINLPLEPVADTPGRLATAASAALGDLADMVLPSGFGVLLAGARGHVLETRCEDRAFARALARLQVAPGRVWQEQYAGTNAIGLALEQGCPSAVIGREHFFAGLSSLAWVAAPVVHPITGRVHGVVGLATRSGADVTLMLTAVRMATGAVEQRLADESCNAERTLLNRFLAHGRRAATPVLAGSDRVELSTPATEGLLAATDRALLWERAREATATASTASFDLALEDGRMIGCEIERVDGGEGAHGMVVRLTPGPETPPRCLTAPTVGATAAAHELVGRTQAMRHLRAEAARLAGNRLPVCVDGEAGAGKLAFARAVAANAGVDTPEILDAAHAAIDGEPAFLKSAATAIRRADATVIVRHVECLSPTMAQALATLIVEGERSGARTILTHTSASGAAAAAQEVPIAALHVHVPPLREHVDDLADIVPAMMRRHGASVEAPSAVLRALVRHAWPGNAGELELVIRDLIARAGGGVPKATDLPETCQGTWRRMGRMEQVERSAIVRALQESNGSKARAAEILGIGRATLYRKLHAYKLDLDTGAR